MDNAKDNRYIAGLDGIRAFAIFFIVAYHFSFGWARGGFLGVDIFFVLSGFLTTSKILRAQENGFDFNLLKFWGGRIQRLLPTAYVVIITTVVWTSLFQRELLNNLLGDAISSIFYTTNWWFIFHKLSYFDSFGSPSPLKHLWFLALQEQFYFLWPIVLISGLRFFKKRSKFSIVIFTGALFSAMLMGLMYNPNEDPSRVYYGTDTRAFELLIGSWLAIVLPIEKLSSKKISDIAKHALNITTLITLAVFIISAVLFDEYTVFLYRGGMLLFSLNAAVLIAGVCQSRGFWGNLLSLRALRWVGTRSYGIYLWHYPIIVLSTPVYEIGNPSYWRVSLQLVIICIIAELSYRFIEVPIRKLGFGEFYKRYLSINIFKWRRLTLLRKISAVIATSVIIIMTFSISSLAKNENKVKKTESYPTEIVINGIEQAATNKDSEVSSTKKNITSLDEGSWTSFKEKKIANLNKEKGTSPAEKVAATSGKKNNKNSQTTIKSYKKVLAIGDSIMLDIAPYLKKYTNITINGKVSRQMSDAIKLAPSYSSFNNTDNAVIIELGTNGNITDKQMDYLLKYFSKSHIYLVNTRVPRSWEKRVNEILKKKAKERENVTLIDWYSVAIKHREYFGSDGVHLKSSGSQALTNLIIQALNVK